MIAMKKNGILFFISLATLCSTNGFCQESVLNKGAITAPHYCDTLPFSIIKNKIVIEVGVNGQKRHFMLDTGAPTVISRSFYKEITSDSVTSNRNVTDANGKTNKLSLVNISSIKLDKSIFRNVPALLLDDTTLILKCLKIDGFIGSNLLRNSIIQFDAKTKRIIITDDLKNLQLGNTNAIDIVLDNQSNPFINILINRKNKETFLFDTGSDEFIALSDHLLSKQKKYNLSIIANGIGSSTMGAFGNGSFTNKTRIKLDEFQFCNSHFRNVISETTPSETSRIGERIFNYGITTIDYIGKKMYFHSYTTNEIDGYEKKWNLTPSFQNNTPVVGTVWSDTLGAKPGETIMAIDGHPLPSDPCEFFLSNPLEGKETAILTIRNKEGINRDILIQKR